MKMNLNFIANMKDATANSTQEVIWRSILDAITTPSHFNANSAQKHLFLSTTWIDIKSYQNASQI